MVCFWNDCDKMQTIKINADYRCFFSFIYQVLHQNYFYITKNYTLLWFSGLRIADQRGLLPIQSYDIWDQDLNVGWMKWILCTYTMPTASKKIKIAYKIFWLYKLSFFMDELLRLSSFKDGEDDICLTQKCLIRLISLCSFIICSFLQS